MQAEALTRALGGRWHGRYGTARCPMHDDRRPSLSVSDGRDGKVLLRCHAGCEFRDIWRAVRDRVRGLVSGGADIEPVRITRSIRDHVRPLIDRIWSQSVPVRRTGAERYLRARSITGPPPDTLRFHSDLRHPSGQRLPAMVARADDAFGNMTAIHRTYLDRERDAKSTVEPVKAMLGPCKVAAVHLRASGRLLVVCEGIETGLSLCNALDADHAVWAALSAPGIAALLLPPADRFGGSLLIACDGDRVGHKAGDALAARAAGLGWSVELTSALAGLDFNDLAMGITHG